MHTMNVFLFMASALAIRAESAPSLLTDVNRISKYWGNLTPYSDNPDNVFGVEYSGLPSGCQIESVQTLQRHAERLPVLGIFDGVVLSRFGRQVTGFTSGNHMQNSFTGPLSFLNSWQPILQNDGLLTGTGAAAEFAAGVSFWNQYGRTLYNASTGQLAYNPNFPNGTARPPVVLRTTDQSRMHNSQINWALGFFGSTNKEAPNPSFINITQPFKAVIIPEENVRNFNNTMAPYHACTNANKQEIRNIGNSVVAAYIPKYLGAATNRLQNFAPAGFTLTPNDTYAMQGICAYEHAFIGNSDFCQLFTEDEWAGFENSLDLKFYYKVAFGNPLGRSAGIGYVQELLARLKHNSSTSSPSSINVTLNNDPETFPLDQEFYADFSHDSILIAVLTAMSIDYFHAPPSQSQFPPKRDRKFNLAQLTPFGARLVTETIGCSSPNPTPRKNARVQYSPSQYGYDASTASYKFIRMRINNGIIPLSTIRGGACGDDNTGRVDGLCALDDFISSQENATTLANYQYACFANFTLGVSGTSGKDWDGTIFA